MGSLHIAQIPKHNPMPVKYPGSYATILFSHSNIYYVYILGLLTNAHWRTEEGENIIVTYRLRK